MSKYKLGDKFIIEIDSHMTKMCRDLYGIKGFRSLVFDDIGLNKLEKYDKDEKANAHIKGFEEGRSVGYDSGYEKGLNDAWECAREIGASDAGTLYDAFGKHFTLEVFGNNSASEAIAKLKEYEAKQNKIEVGDEVNVGEEGKGVVIGVTEANYLVWKADDTGGDFHEACWYGKSRVSKTGSHYYIESILDKLRDER